jgi:hypothetical protein
LPAASRPASQGLVFDPSGRRKLRPAQPAPLVRGQQLLPLASRSPDAGPLRGVESVGIVSATFRLPATLPPALLKASSDRKIKKVHPFTQQDIVAEALTDWLKKNGCQV